MDEAGNTKDDLKLPSGTDEAEKLARDLADEFEDGKELVVTVIKVRAGCERKKLGNYGEAVRP